MRFPSQYAFRFPYREPGRRSASADRLTTPVLCILAVSLTMALGGCKEESAEAPVEKPEIAAAPIAATANSAPATEDRAQLPIDTALSEYLAAERIRVIKLVGQDGEITTFDSSGHELLVGETPPPDTGSSMEPVPASAPVTGETLGSCNVGGTPRTCHRLGFPNAGKYHVNQRHAGSCACQ